MGFFKRLLGREKKESRTTAYIMNDGIVGAVYPEQDYEKIAREAYQQNLIAYKCIKMIADACGSIPWNQYQNDADGMPEEVNDGPISDLLYRPNPQQGWAGLMQSLVSYYLLDGNGYGERVTLKTGPQAGLPKELYSLRPDRMKVIKGLRSVTGYRYGDGHRSATFDVDLKTGQSDILHLMTFNPLDDFYGWAPTMSAAGHIDNSNDALSWNRGMMKNGARPGTVITMERSLSVEQYEKYLKSMQSKYGGPQNAGKIVILDNLGEGKVDIKPWGWNPKELDFTESSREDARRIAFAYGVPPQLIGIPGDNTYSNMQEARAVFWEDTVVPLMCYIRDELNNWLYPRGSELWIDFDLNDIPALEIRREAAWKRIQDADYLTINEKRAAHGYDAKEGGDAIFMPMSMTPVIGEGAGTGETPEDDTPLTEEQVESEEAEARNQLLATGIPEEMLDSYVGLKEEFFHE